VTAMKIGIGLYGSNGHQIEYLLEGHPKAELIAISAFNKSRLPNELRNAQAVRSYTSLEDMLKDKQVELVSLCSPYRKDQARDAIRCMEAGKHVYAEKPCAMSELDLDAIMETSLKTGCQFHEMAGTAFDEPYYSIRKTIKIGVIGEVIQVFAQKSYPYHDQRPQDEDVDGGLLCQAGVHALRFIEHVAGLRIMDIQAIETKLGNPIMEGNLHMAAAMMMSLENGGIASATANYLNPSGFGQWGNEHLRIFGTKGFIESVDGGSKTRIVIGAEDLGAIQCMDKTKDYFDYFIDNLCDGEAMPLTIEEELHPTRMVLRAKVGVSNKV